MTGPSAHLSWDELACWNRTGKPWNGIPPGTLVAPYPLDLRESRVRVLAAVFEAIRAAVSLHTGHETPIVVNSAYRTPEYDRAIGGKSNRHPRGDALDLLTPQGLSPEAFHEIILKLAKYNLADIGGLGAYGWGCHVDLRPRGAARIARWDYRPKGATA
jgi:hypothetical protein